MPSGVYKRKITPKGVFKKGSTPWNKGIKTGIIPPNAFDGSLVGKNAPNWKGGKPECLGCGKILTTYHTKRCMECAVLYRSGENHWNWKGGVAHDKEYKLEYKKEYRHRTGTSKKYQSERNISKTKEYRALQRHKRRVLVNNGGKLTIKTIQTVYEDNIKKFGTLTCYLCEKSIKFGKDTLEHKIPLSRGGTNKYENLAIACHSCNSKKSNKTVSEYKEYLLQKGGI